MVFIREAAQLDRHLRRPAAEPGWGWRGAGGCWGRGLGVARTSGRPSTEPGPPGWAPAHSHFLLQQPVMLTPTPPSRGGCLDKFGRQS